jgi:hypothetical protein
MPQIPISDVLGIDVNGALSQDAKLQKMLTEFLHFRDTPLDQIPVNQVKANLNFEKPLDVSAGDLRLKVGASGGGSMTLIGPKQRALDEGDPFDAIAVKADERYVALELDFSMDATLSATAGAVTFGLSGHKGFDIKCYRRFQDTGAGFPMFLKAIGAAASGFLLPRDLSDLGKLDSDTVVVIAGSGVLSVSGGFTISMPVQALASVGPIAGQELAVNAHGSFGTKATLTMTGEYQIRLRRVHDGVVEIGVYTLKSRDAALRVSGAIGVSATVAHVDLAEKFIDALSRQPAVDKNEFRQALPGEDGPAKERQIEGFESSLSGAIAMNVEASVTAALSSLRSDEAVWLFEVDLDAATSSEATAAITSALAGDFTALTRDPNTLPAGITQKEDIFTKTELHKQKLNVNVLGILNLMSVAKLTRMSTIERNAKGEITLITDTSSASRMEALLLNAGVNARRLRKMLSENFLIEAAYHATDLGVLPPEFKSRHTYLEIHDATSKQAMKDNLDVARVLDLIGQDEENRRLSKKQFGRTTFYAEIRYKSDMVRRIFLDDTGAPRSIEDYETTGRSALGALLSGDAGQEFRHRYTDLGIQASNLWNDMKGIGNVAGFGPLFGLSAGTSDPRVGAAGADYITIVRWAAAMHEAGTVIREVEEMLAGSLSDVRLTKAREHLKGRMADVVSRTHEHFGDPLGLVMVYLASGQNGQRSMIASGPEIERLEISSPVEPATHAVGG